MITNKVNSARFASLDELLQTTIPAFLAPLPSKDTLRDWFAKAGVPRFKINPTAKRGGGTVFYSVAAVEKLLQQQTLPGGGMKSHIPISTPSRPSEETALSRPPAVIHAAGIGASSGDTGLNALERRGGPKAP